MALHEPFRVSFAGPVYASEPIASLQSDGASLDLVTEIAGLEWTTQLPGGFGTARITLSLPQMRRRFPNRAGYDFLRPFGDVTITAPRGAIATVFRGRIMGIVYTGVWPTTVNVVGYGVTGLTDQPYLGSSATIGTAGSVITDVLAHYCPTLSIGTIVDTGVSHAPAEYQWMMPSQVIDALTKEGGIPASGAAAALWDFVAYRPSQSGALLADFLPRLAPQQPPYLIPVDDDLVWEDDFTEAYGGANARYTPAASIATISTPAISTLFTNTFGITRTVIFEAGNTTAAAANQLADAYLTFRQLGMPKITVSRGGGRGLELFGGSERPAYLVRAGEWAAIGEPTNLPTVQASLARGPYICVQTHYDAKSDVATFTFNESPRDEIGFLFDIYKVSRHQIRLTAPSSGARII
jgi:hypothetical protein